MPVQVRMGLTLSEVTGGLGKRFGEKGVSSLHDALHPRIYYRIKRNIRSRIESAGATEALWLSATTQFQLGDFGQETETLISALIGLTYEALVTGDYEELGELVHTLLAADADQRPTGPPRRKAGVMYRRALVKQIWLDYLPASNQTTAHVCASSAIDDTDRALKLLRKDVEAGRDDCIARVLTAKASLFHRHFRGQLGHEKYVKLLARQRVVECLWISLRAMPKGHPRAEVTASNLTNFCSLLRRPDTRQAYIHLLAVNASSRALTYKAPTALFSFEDDPDCEHLRAELRVNPITKEEVLRCKLSLL